MRSLRGFTLIELMIVVAIIAIIAAIAIPSLMRSRMATNQVAAIASCRAFCEAQEVYHRTDYDGDAKLEYAMTLRGDFSLLEQTTGAGDLALIDKAFAEAEGDPATAAAARAGYVFTVLTGQGANVAPGAKTWARPATGGGSPNDLIHGYGLSAMPAGYDNTGRDTFVINAQARSYQKDRGNGVLTQEVLFDPDTTWAVAE